MNSSTLTNSHPVQELLQERGMQGYYLIPWEQDGNIAMVIHIDALSGVLQGVAPIRNPLAHLFLSPEEANRAVEEKLHRHSLGQEELVWRPCRESTSPLRPLYQVPHEQGLAYVGMDGTVFPRLTPLGHGG